VEAAIEMDIQKQYEFTAIEKSDADYGSPVHAVVKPDSESGYRFTLDLRDVNEGVVTNRFMFWDTWSPEKECGPIAVASTLSWLCPSPGTLASCGASWE
jgi:hypothetical protein